MSMNSRRLANIVGGSLILGGSLVLACDGSRSTAGFAMASPPDSFGEDSIPPPAPTSPGLDSPCPGYEPPVEGSDCSGTMTVIPWSGTCEYGHDTDKYCNDHFVCEQGLWMKEKLSGCPSDGPRCPGSISAIVAGDPCDDVTVGCSYLEGTCACVEQPTSSDGGTPEAIGRWVCAPPPGNGCPPQRPPVEADCVRAMSCDYGSCALNQELTYVCEPSPNEIVPNSRGQWLRNSVLDSCP